MLELQEPGTPRCLRHGSHPQGAYKSRWRRVRIFNYRARGGERYKRCVSEARRKEKLVLSGKCKTQVPCSPVQTLFSRRLLRVPIKKKKKLLGRTDNMTPTLLTTLEAYSRAALVIDTKEYKDLWDSLLA